MCSTASTRQPAVTRCSPRNRRSQSQPRVDANPACEEFNVSQKPALLAREGPYARSCFGTREEPADQVFDDRNVSRRINLMIAVRASHVGIEKAEIDDLDIEVVAVLRPLLAPFAVDQRLVRQLDGKQLMILFVPGTAARATEAHLGPADVQNDVMSRGDVIHHGRRFYRG